MGVLFPILRRGKSFTLCSSKWILAQKLRIPKKQLAKHMKLKKKEDQSVDTSLLLRIGGKHTHTLTHEMSYRDKVWS